jgi:hypothetical protein
LGDGSLGHDRGTWPSVAASGRGFRRPADFDEGDAGLLLHPTAEQKRWARRITSRIVQQVADLHLLIEEAHEGRAHVILGYSRWDDYVREHFNFGRTQAHNYLLQGRVVRALGSAANGAKVEVAPTHAKRIHPVLDEVVDVLRRFIEAGHDPDWSVQAVIDWYGRPTKPQAIGVVKALPEARDAMGVQLIETGALAELEPDPQVYRNAVALFVAAFEHPVPKRAWLETQNHADRKRLLREIAEGEKWLAALRDELAELPPGPPMPPPPSRRRRTPPPARRTPPAS